ncbi:MAG: glycosyl hydrolase 53 family protein [Anaerolineae bacterium]|nr:glycosyl hydrolase 53 family protein [Anaerolineae bacterium]
MNHHLLQRAAWLILTLALLAVPAAQGQEAAPTFFFGVDLSYVNEMDDCGAVYRQDGIARDAFALFAEHGATLVRARLWHNPDWTAYSTLDDVKRTFARARAAGMTTLLDIHYSDQWADPGRQEIPAAWQELDDDALVDAVYQYTTEVLESLADEDLTPAFVQIGNETNSGILKRGSDLQWARDARLFNAGIRAVRDFSAAAGQPVRIVLHVAQPENTMWWFTQAEAAGVTDFDLIGVSFYPQWSTFSIGDMGAQVGVLRRRFGKEVMVVETGYGWTRDAVEETADNVLDQGLRGYPFSPDGQHRFMRDLTQSLISGGALGVVYWEPAWVSTPCHTRWGQGSHWENATFFDFHNGNELLEGVNFLRDDYLYPPVLADGVVEPAYGEALVTEDAGDALNGVAALDLLELYAYADADQLHLAFTTAGDIFAREGSYLLYFDATHDAEGANADVGRRPILAADPYKPEFRLDVSILEEQATRRGSIALNAWAEGDWQTLTYTGGAAILNGVISVVELQLPLALIDHPDELHLALVSTDRGRARGASDILGTDAVPADSEAALLLEQFFRLDLAP